MQLIISRVSGGGFTEIVVEHGKESIAFSCRVFSKIKLPDPARIYLELNEYLKTTSEESQDNIFKSFKKIRELYDMDFEPTHIAASLAHEVEKIYKNVDMHSARRWLSTIGNVHVPPEIEDRIDGNSRYTKKEQTYLRHDYVNLASVCMMLRFMLPVWGEYIDQTTDNERHKETEALGLISRANIIEWPINEYDYDGEEISSVFDKVSDYVRFCAEDRSVDLGQLWKGYSSVEIPVHITAKVLVRRLPIVSLNDHTSHSIVANIFQYVKSNVAPQERTSADKVKDKHPGTINDDDDKNSYVEGYKIKQRISQGDVVAFNLDALDYQLMASKVDPTIDLKKLELCISAMDDNLNYAISPHQVMLSQWVMAKAFPAKAFNHIDKLSTHHLIACAQALVWHWGFPEMAVFFQVNAVYQTEYGSTNQLNQTHNGNRIAGRHKQELEIKYPHMRPGRISNNGTRQPNENMASIAINEVSQSLRSSNWNYRGPSELYDETDQSSPNRVLIIPINIKHVITDLVVHLADLNS